MRLITYNLNNEPVGEIVVSDAVFGAEVRPHMHHEAVRHYLASQRSGTHATLNRKRVSGSTRKLYKQKGVGRARHGSVKANNFVGGGIVFGPQPRSYDYKLSRNFRRSALRSALSEKVASGQLKVVVDFSMATPKTKDAQATLGRLGTPSALVVTAENASVEKSVRNLQTSSHARPEQLNVYRVLSHKSLVITVEAIQNLDGVLQS